MEVEATTIAAELSRGSLTGMAPKARQCQDRADAHYMSGFDDGGTSMGVYVRELHAFFQGRSPDLMVDLDDDVTVNRPYAGNHGSLHETDMRIPLILSGAGIRRGAILGKASLVDIAPTIVKLLGRPGAMLRPDGHALEDALASGENR